MTFTGANAQHAYQQNQFQTASPGELTLMLFNGCLKFIKLAEKAMDEKDHENKNVNISKAQNIIRELMVTLRVSDETTEQMMKMYDFIYDQLVQANVQSDREALKTANTFVAEFRDTWKQVVQLDRKERHASGARLQ
ncbi:flagellar biosynthesis protein FliS [Geomicrobium sp. JCM 19037]|uniref:flagellar export chaperone FliS n=1 Tax=Geomicrobium sp. JCM 19037 TaxID=1460634 RepID=UPI00045F2170|nr:flagellar export chaperone FliS [Geomicrobium sp. JCM 19037]GAK02601.1 flagellar biosynthesis protein FliS [Geomicrobium sp. JCM 19037]